MAEHVVCERLRSTNQDSSRVYDWYFRSSMVVRNSLVVMRRMTSRSSWKYGNKGLDRTHVLLY